MISQRPGISLLAVAGSLLLATLGLAADTVDPARVVETLDGRILAGEQSFDSWRDYAASEFFEDNGKHCGLQPNLGQRAANAALGGSAADCTFDITNPSAVYDPTVAKYRIPVVVHVIQNSSGSGFLSASKVRSQIDILNEDFLALLGSNGENGTDAQIEFFLATEDPGGNATTGITYTTNDSWFNDNGAYWNTLAWDTNRYLNIYTNTASGNLGYVPNLPQGGIAGSNEDRVVVLWSSFGRNGSIGPPYNQGRTTTHEVGHYLGLDHTFGGGCGSVSACYTTGDLICDTNRQAAPTSGCTDQGSCGSPDPIQNYMDYSADLCMEEFTPEQSRRMRCSLENYRPDLLQLANTECGNGIVESGEECDDGNTADGDGCNAACRIETECGNGVVEADEECDDGNTMNGDGCDASCVVEPGCGNGFVEPGEECDDGNTASGDGCDENCVLEPVCGNGVIETGEACDDGNTTGGDGCDSGCSLEPVCGNEILEAGEECEPPATASCDASCQRIALCGDGILDPGEECDDGNVAPLDGCDDTCRIENVPNDCCLTGHGAGCSVAAIQTCVCSYDPFCCVFEWEELCVGLVEELGCGACSVAAPAEVSQPGAVQPLIFASRDAILWEDPDASGASAFNLYLGEIGTLRQGNYGSCLEAGIGDSSTIHEDTPPSGATWTYVVSGTNAVGEGPLGSRSDGSPRATVAACP